MCFYQNMTGLCDFRNVRHAFIILYKPMIISMLIGPVYFVSEALIVSLYPFPWNSWEVMQRLHFREQVRQLPPKVEQHPVIANFEILRHFPFLNLKRQRWMTRPASGLMQFSWGFFPGDRVKTAARNAAKSSIAYGTTLRHMSWNFYVRVISGQVIRLQKEVQCHVQISIIFMHPSHPQFQTDFFQTFRMRLVHQVVKISFVFYVADLRWAGGHDLVMLSLWEKYSNYSDSENTKDAASSPKILKIAASSYHFCT